MENKIILIQGAMDIEVQKLLEKLEEQKKNVILDYEFYTGKLKNCDVIVSKTQIGTINATIATTIGIEKFKPDMVINQGIAGAHRENIHTGDIIIGEKCCNINAYSMPSKNRGEGSNPFEWEPNKRAKEIKNANSELVQKFQKFLKEKYTGKVYTGTIGSGDVFSREIDRIDWISNNFGNLCEDMESIGVYSVCNKFSIPCIGIRIISNNEITGESLDKEQAIILQELLLQNLDKRDTPFCPKN